MAAYENREAEVPRDDDITNDALRDQIIDSIQESTGSVEAEIQEARDQIMDHADEANAMLARGFRQMAAEVQEVGEEYIRFEHQNHEHRLAMEARFTERLETRINNGEVMYRRFLDEVERMDTRLANIEGQREKLDTIATSVVEMAKQGARGVKRTALDDDDDDEDGAQPSTPARRPVKRQRSSSAEQSSSSEWESEDS